MMLASTCVSSSGQYTGASVARATGATAPTWSKWVWVMRIASTVSMPRLSSAPSSFGGLVAWVDDQRCRASLRRTMKQFSCTGPTVNMRTSSWLTCAAAAAASLLAPAVHAQLHVVAARDVERRARTGRRSPRSRAGCSWSRPAARKMNISTEASPRAGDRLPSTSAACSAAAHGRPAGSAVFAPQRSAADRCDRAPGSCRRPSRGAWCGACAWSGPW